MTKEEGEKLLKKIHEETYKIEVEVLDGGTMPSKKNPKDAGWDLYATEDIQLWPGQVLKHPLNIRLKLPTNCWAEITTKSGLGAKGQLVYAGVIDELYRGIPHVVMSNIMLVTQGGFTNSQPINIKKGEKLAQLIMNPYSEHYYLEQVEKVDTDTARGEGGFGSTGR